MEAVIDQIYAHQDIIWRICHTFCPDREDRKDLFQEIVIKLWKASGTFKQQSRFSTWLYRVALNTAITYKKKRSGWLAAPFTPEIAERSFEDQTERESEIRTLYRAIDQLNRVEKAIILLYLEEKSYEEIADITGFTRTNVSVKLVRIKKKLEKIYHTLAS